MQHSNTVTVTAFSAMSSLPRHLFLLEGQMTAGFVLLASALMAATLPA